MAIEFRCHQCDTLLRTGDDKAGKRAKCPNCGTMVQTPFPEGAAADDDDFDYEDYEVDEAPAGDAFSQHFGGPATSSAGQPSSSRRIECVMCGELIPVNARTCRYCGEPVSIGSGGPSPATSYQGVPTSGLAVASLVLGILGIVFSCFWPFGIPCALLATIFGATGLKVTANGEREGRGMAVAGLSMGIVGLLFCLLFVLAFFGAQRGRPGPFWFP